MAFKFRQKGSFRGGWIHVSRLVLKTSKVAVSECCHVTFRFSLFCTFFVPLSQFRQISCCYFVLCMLLNILSHVSQDRLLFAKTIEVFLVHTQKSHILQKVCQQAVNKLCSLCLSQVVNKFGTSCLITTCNNLVDIMLVMLL